MPTVKPLPIAEARSQLWKAVSDNKAVHVDHLLTSYPALATGAKPTEATPEDGSQALGWYARALSHLPLLSRPEHAADTYQRALDTLEVLHRHAVPFEGVNEFNANPLIRKLISHPSSPYGGWFVEKELLSHEEVMGVAFPKPRKAGPRS